VDILDKDGTKIKLPDERVHIHDPGRLKEILYSNNHVLLKQIPDDKKTTRKTGWDLIAGRCNNQWVLIHSGYHRAIAEAVLRNDKINPVKGVIDTKPEVQVGHSRLDFRVSLENGNTTYIEVKGCTFAKNSIALFPDAPTLRGTRHLRTLIDIKKSGTGAALFILIFRLDSTCFAPNGDTDPAFAATFRTAIKAGIEVHPMVFTYKNKSIHYLRRIPLCSGN
jgi:sugar fermentation stimulation protein A